MSDFDIIIIGAGAAGLIAARELSKVVPRVAVLEARDRLGGRIHTYHDPAFAIPVELGAEFIHGDLPVTLALCKEYHLPLTTAKGEFWHMGDDDAAPRKQDNAVEDHHHILERTLKGLKEDITVEQFLQHYFSDDKYESLRYSIRKFVEGFDAADVERASTFVFREEWLDMNEGGQYRIQGGYSRLINLVAEDAISNGADIFLSTVVTEIHWKKNDVIIYTEGKDTYTAKKIIVTLPPSLLKAQAGIHGSIVFVPPLPDKIAAASALGYGDVIKVIMQFEHAFWKDKEVRDRLGKDLNGLGFIFSDETMPTWWTQEPDKASILTGWLAGPPAKQMKTASDEAIFDAALFSLINIFKDESLHPLAWRVVNWANDPFTRGAYSYATVNTRQHVEIMKQAVEDTLFFSGEALHIGIGEGTVEAAFSSGIFTSVEVQKRGD